MKKCILLFVFSIMIMPMFAQDLKNPRLESTNGAPSYSSGNYLLFVDPGRYIQISNISVSDLKSLMDDVEKTKRTDTEQQKLLDGQKKEIDELKKLVSTQQRQLDGQGRTIEDLKKNINQLSRNVEELQRKVR